MIIDDFSKDANLNSFLEFKKRNNYQLKEVYFQFMKSFYGNNKSFIKHPFKSNWFKKRTRLKELEKNNNSDKLYKLVEAFTFKWKLKELSIKPIFDPCFLKMY